MCIGSRVVEVFRPFKCGSEFYGVGGGDGEDCIHVFLFGKGVSLVWLYNYGYGVAIYFII